MEARSRITARVDELLALFQRRSDDIPDGLFDRRTQFVLNGVPFEETLGRSPSDPLVLMLTRGPAGYRLTLKALLHAIPDATIERGEFDLAVPGHVRWQGWLSGNLRGTGGEINTVFDATLTLSAAGVVERAAVDLEEANLARIREARMRP